MILKEQLQALKHVMKMHKNRKAYFLKALFFHQIAAILPIFTGLAVKKVFEQYTLPVENNPVLTTAMFFIALLFSRIIFVAINSYYNSKGRFIFASDLRLNLISGILKKPGAENLNLSTGDTLNRIKVDADQIESFAYDNLMHVLTSITMTVISLVILCSINAVMTFFVFTPVILMVYIMEWSGKHVSKYRLENRKTTGDVSSAIGEVFSNIQAVQVNAAEDSVLDHLKELNQIRAKSATKDNVFSQMLGTLYENIFNIGTGVILLFMAIMNDKMPFSLGNFVIFTYYMNFVSFFIMFTGNAFTKYKQIQVSFDHLNDIHESMSIESLTASPLFDAKKEVDLYEETTKEHTELQELKIENLNYTYPNSTNGIDDISFTIKKESFTVIAGRIGSGKSTLLKNVSGLLVPDSGHLKWNEQTIVDSNTFMSPPKLSYTPQIPKFFSDSILENIKLGYSSTDIQEENSVYCSVLEPDLKDLSDGLKTSIGTNGVKLSGGQQLRLAVARMLLRDADLYAFDDISSALDIETDTLMWERIMKRKNGAYVVVSNQKHILEKADQVILLKEGKLEAVGSYEQLIKSHEEMRLIVEGERIS